MVGPFDCISLDLLCSITLASPDSAERKIPPKADASELGRKAFAIQHGRNNFIFARAALWRPSTGVGMQFDSKSHGRVKSIVSLG